MPAIAGGIMSGDAEPLENVMAGASAVAIDGRALMIIGASGSGKSSLALALIHRGADLIGDDALTLSRDGAHVIVSPPPNISGKLEIHGIGIAEMPLGAPAPLSLVLDLDGPVTRLPQPGAVRTICGIDIPWLGFDPGSIAPAERALAALRLHALVFV
ncbi:HPr kinase/phosphorylase [Qipengyuania nanhaisediminis]|uniref:HPr kinase/phosphorylase n=1 Tax=Qipengyuania nanhaisediminis TaxID=604088 RepID=UPI0038B2AA03